MPFDLNSAVEIETTPTAAPAPRPAFDLNSAQVIDDDVPRQNIYRESTNTTVNAPIGLRAEQIEYADDVDNHSVPKDNFMGYVDLMKSNQDKMDRAFYKSAPYVTAPIRGAVNFVAETILNQPAYVAQRTADLIQTGVNKPDVEALMAKRHAGETLTPEEEAQVLKGVGAANNPFAFLFKNPFEQISEEGSPKAVAASAALTETAKNIKTFNDELLRSMKLDRNRSGSADTAEQVLFDFGNAGGSIASSIGLLYLTGSPAAATAFFGANQNQSIYMEATNKEVPIEVKEKSAQLAGMVEGGLEFVGLRVFERLAQASKPVTRILGRSLEEAAQEGLQQTGEELITQSSGIRDFDPDAAARSIAYSAMLGFIGGGTVASVVEATGADAKSKGFDVNPQALERLAASVQKNMPEIEASLLQALNDQTSSLRTTKEDREQVAKIMSDFAAGKEIDLSKLSPDVQEALQSLVPQSNAVVNPSEPIEFTEEQPAIDTQADYDRVALGDIEEPTRTKNKETRRLIGDVFAPVSTRLNSIDPKLKHVVRDFVFSVGMKTHEGNVVVKPFIEGVDKSMNDQDRRVLDFALKNGDMEKADSLMTKYGLEEEWKNTRRLLDEIFKEAQDVGMEIGFIENYFPRDVKRGMVGDYIAAMRGQKEWSQIQMEMRKEDPNNQFTEEEKAEFVNKWLRGYKNKQLALSRPGNAKSRSIDYITPEMGVYYEDSISSLMNYISSMRETIEARKMFGHSEKETEKNIGKYVLDLVEQGVITQQQEKLVRRILRAVVEPKGPSRPISALKNSTYIYTMGSPISALTQLQDLAFSFYKNGLYQTGKSFLKAVTLQSEITKEDIGISHILEELKSGDTTGNAVRKVFKVIGLSFMDNVGKETYINAAKGRLKKAAIKGGEEFQRQMDVIFGEEAAQTIEDLKNEVLSENVRYLLFSEISDVQPVSLAEMPIGYLRGGDMRILYMLKTYTIKQIDLYRNDIFSKIVSGNPKETVKGLKNLTNLAMAMMVMGMGTDALKDLLLGRDVDLDDLTMDNILKTLGFTKYQIYKTRKEGIMAAFWSTVIPPVGSVVDDVQKDVTGVVSGDKELENLEVLQRIPLFGKFYYWWLGAGSQKPDD